MPGKNALDLKIAFKISKQFLSVSREVAIMVPNIHRFFLLIIGVLFCLFGCDSERGNFLLPNNILSENILSETPQPPSEGINTIANTETSFEQNLLPILTARCAFAGCHVAGGPNGIDLSTYQAFVRGGNDGSIFTPGNAQSSDIIEEIVSGRMPIGGPRLTDAQIQLFRDWINNQKVIADRPIVEPPQIQTPELIDNTISFEQHLLPILTARCAYSGCHDANGPYDLDFRTYQTFIRSAEDEDVFVPGNARSSDIIEEIVSGRMPPDSPPLTAAQIQLFRDWINQQDPADFPNLRYDDDDDHNDDHDDDDHDDDGDHDDHDHDAHDDGDHDEYDEDDDDHDDDDDDDHEDDDDDDD